ncbi:hypothetical protein F5148DRAFT_1379979 [Russula earlei]|uniref:Uncharacterized protein n=1 Tax=Russula earlei TaxID=71964 RepID=A0ACC0TU12_9AGAM|nr:hypothetical protein F5148DRAFT_1379979 [Russula earlei]
MVPASHFPVVVPPTFLNVTAISAQNGQSVLECWQILPGFSNSSQSGTVGPSILRLGNVANMSYSVIPPGFNGGLNNAPTTQWVALLSGLGHVTLPDSSDEAYFGKGDFLFAADTAAVSIKGHLTNFPSQFETAILQIPTGGTIPQHSVLYSGPCKTHHQPAKRVGSLNDLD